jgi:hypothetical protein
MKSKNRPKSSTSFKLKLIIFSLSSFVFIALVGAALTLQILFGSPSPSFATTPTAQPHRISPTPAVIFFPTIAPPSPTAIPPSPTAIVSSPIESSCEPFIAPTSAIDTRTGESIPTIERRGIFFVFNDERDGNSDIYMTESDGSYERRLTDNPAYDGWPIVIERQIAFYSTRDGNANIYIMDLDGSNEQPLTTNPGEDTLFESSPYGGLIVFTSDRDGNENIYLMNTDGSDQRPLTMHPGNDTAPRWSDDGMQIVFTSDRDHEGQYIPYLMNVDGTNQRPIALNLPGNSTMPDFSPDGRQIVFTLEHDEATDIFTINTDGTHLCQITHDADEEMSVQWWSKDEIYYRARPSDSLVYNSYAMFLDGSNHRKLNKDPEPSSQFALPTTTPFVLISPTPGESPQLYGPISTPLELNWMDILDVENAGKMTETIKIRSNTGSLQLRGWTVSDGKGHTYTFQDVRLFSGAEIVLHTTSGEGTPVDYYWGLQAPVWSIGEVITLKDAQGNVVDTYTIGQD